MELAKIYSAYEKIQNLDFSKKEIIEPRGINIPKEVAYELGNELALKLKEAEQDYFFVSGDGRISTPELMQAFTTAMLDNGINVIYAGYNNITPMFEVERNKLSVSGVNITASHNPWKYNGFKMVIEKAKKEKIESRVEEFLKKGGMVQKKNYARIYYLQSILKKDYIEELENKFSQFFKPRNDRKEKILYDALHGPSFPFYSAVAQKLHIKFDGFREDIDGYFPLTDGGPNPLIKENFEILRRNVSSLKNYSLILISDGDGDRMSIAFPSGLIDFAVLGAVRAIYLAENSDFKNPKFVAEYALASMIEDYLREKNIEVVHSRRNRVNLKAKIQELREKGEEILGGQEVGTHPYNSVGIDDGVEAALLFSALLQTKGRKGLEETIGETKENIKPHIHEIRVDSKEPDKIVNKLLKQQYATEKFNDVVCNFNETEAVIHSSNTAKQITVNAYSNSLNNPSDTLKRDLNKLFIEIDKIEKSLGEKMAQELEIIS